MVTSSTSDDAARAPDDVTIDHDLHAAAQADVPDQPTHIDRYTILGVVGMGGMGVVYTAYDPKLDRKIALKLLREPPDRDALTTLTAGKARLLREAQALARLTHPNVVQVYDVDVWNGQLYITMEYVEGRSLKSWLAQGRHPWREVVRVFRAAGAGVAAAHAQGIVHRDFKPDNVLLGDDGRVRVLDFGLAKRADEAGGAKGATPGASTELPALSESSVLGMAVSAGDLTLTQAGRSVGTPAYMSPEQHLGLDVGPETDQFSFCVSLWEALYGELPFAGDSLDERFRNVVEGNLRSPPADSGVPTWLHRVLVRGLASRPEDRFPSMAALLHELGRDPARQRLRVLAAAGGLMLLVGAGVGVVQARNARAELCAGGPAHVARLWNEDAGARIRQAFLDTKLPFAHTSAVRVVERLDAHARRWADTFGAVCRATRVHGEQSEHLMDQRMACLQRDLAQVSTLIDTFTAPSTTTVERAVSAVDQLDDPSACATWTPSAAAPALDAEQAALAQTLRTDLARARALQTAGQPEPAAELARTVSDRARQAKLPGVCAHALTVLATAEQSLGKWEDAEHALTEAVRMATRAGDAPTEAQAWATLMFLEARERGEHESARALMLPSETALERAGHPDSVEAVYQRSLGTLLAELGDSKGALAAYRRAAELSERLYGPDSPNTARDWSNLAVALARAGHTDEAESYLQRAVDLLERVLGAEHPQVAGVKQNLANIAIKRGDYAKARGLLLQVVTVRKATGSPRLASTLVNLGVANRGLHDLPAARDSYLEAERLMRQSRGERYPHLVAIYNNLANLYDQLREPERALSYAEKAVALARDIFEPGHHRRASAWQRLCQVRNTLGQHEAARQACERGLQELRAKHGQARPSVPAAGEILLTLGDIDLTTGHARAALERAQAAREVFAAHPSEHANMARTQALLARALWALGRTQDAARQTQEAMHALRRAGPALASETDTFTAWAREHGLDTGEIKPSPVPR